MVCIAVTFFSRNESLHFEIINLQHIYSIRYTEKSAVVDEEDPEDSGWICKKSQDQICPILLYIILKNQSINDTEQY